MQMPGRKFTAAGSGYRYGFNGKELDTEVSGTTTYDYGFRISSPALGRFLSVDPLTNKYPELTPYQFASNRPIDGIDEDGLEWKQTYDKKGNLSGASWVGFKENGDAVDGTVSNFNLSTSQGNYYYSSNKKTQSGSLSFFPKGVTSNSGNTFGSVTHSATNEWNYTISFNNKPQEWTSILGFKHSDNIQNYDVTARIWKNPLNSSEDVTIGNYNSINENGRGFSGLKAINAASDAFGLSQRSDAITAVYPETFLLPLPKLGVVGKLGAAVEKGTGYAGAGYFKLSYRFGGQNSLKLASRLTKIGEADIRGIGYGQFDVAHRAATFLGKEIINSGKLTVRSWKEINLEIINGGRKFSITANPWTRRVWHFGPNQ
jgi:RHS repeat-associated protein